MIRPIYPSAGEPIEDLAALIAGERRDGDRWVLVNMVSSVDGATAVRGGATGLTDPDDQALFRAYRAACDVVLVGASTVRAENYGPVVLDDAQWAARTATGRTSLPPIAVVTGSLDLDPAARLFEAEANPPLIFTGTSADPAVVGQISEKAEVVVASDMALDVSWVIDHLTARGHRVILCEGGPTINGQLAGADLIDEFNVAFSPMLVAGRSSRLSHGPTAVELPMRLDRVMIGDSMMFCRWIRGER